MSLMECDVVIDPEAFDGARNMKLDAALLETGCTSDRCIVRIYAWQEPTISVGYFQKESPVGFPEGIPLVRRLTGGGAILHHHEITYSCVLPNSHPLRHNPTELYAAMHRRIIRLLEECGVSSCLRRDLSTSTSGSAEPFAAIERRLPAVTDERHPNASVPEPFLCFLREDPNDIVDRITVDHVPAGGNTACANVMDEGQVIDDHAAEGVKNATHTGVRYQETRRVVKFVGSAQRRRRGTILQHGSILLRGSELAANIPGIIDRYPEFRSTFFRQELPWRLAGAIADRASERQYLPQELEFVENLCL